MRKSIKIPTTAAIKLTTVRIIIHNYKWLPLLSIKLKSILLYYYWLITFYLEFIIGKIDCCKITRWLTIPCMKHYYYLLFLYFYKSVRTWFNEWLCQIPEIMTLIGFGIIGIVKKKTMKEFEHECCLYLWDQLSGIIIICQYRADNKVF